MRFARHPLIPAAVPPVANSPTHSPQPPQTSVGIILKVRSAPRVGRYAPLGLNKYPGYGLQGTHQEAVCRREHTGSMPLCLQSSDFDSKRTLTLKSSVWRPTRREEGSTVGLSFGGPRRSRVLRQLGDSILADFAAEIGQNISMQKDHSQQEAVKF